MNKILQKIKAPFLFGALIVFNCSFAFAQTDTLRVLAELLVK